MLLGRVDEADGMKTMKIFNGFAIILLLTVSATFADEDDDSNDGGNHCFILLAYIFCMLSGSILLQTNVVKRLKFMTCLTCGSSVKLGVESNHTNITILCFFLPWLTYSKHYCQDFWTCFKEQSFLYRKPCIFLLLF